MFSRILYKMQEKVRRREYVVTQHARKEMMEDGLTIYDVERVILTGKIEERQKDRETEEWKYRVMGQTISRFDADVVAKLSITNKMVIITVYLL